jgi:hypothetical protein
MRILDKNTDFYDYLQRIYPDPTFTFDRTDSFILSKEIMCRHLSQVTRHYRPEKPQLFMLLQVCNTFWLFLVSVLDQDGWHNTTDYSAKLVTTWKNYNRERVLMDLSIIAFGWEVRQYIYTNSFTNFDEEKVFSKESVLRQAINEKNYRAVNTINSHRIYYGNNDSYVERHLPLLKACGLAPLIDDLDIFLAFEEYFSLEKSENERREPLGATNNDKIERHGFDLKNSFRGKAQ